MCSEESLHNRSKRVRIAFEKVSELIIADNNGTMLNGILKDVCILVVGASVNDTLTNQFLKIGDIIGSLEIKK